MKLFALHGFLGLPSDFNFLADFNFLDVERIPIKPAKDLETWAEEFNRSIIRDGSHDKNVLIGYSMGGRLALHAWENRPTLWDKLILISTHPGLTNEEEKQKRIESDEKWARRFETEDWNSLMQAWNNQEVLKGMQIDRAEKDYDRKELAAYLRNFSLGKQKVIEPQAIWLVGENDTKFRTRLNSLNPILVPNSGHRIPFENPQFLKNFLEEL